MVYGGMPARRDNDYIVYYMVKCPVSWIASPKIEL